MAYTVQEPQTRSRTFNVTTFDIVPETKTQNYCVNVPYTEQVPYTVTKYRAVPVVDECCAARLTGGSAGMGGGMGTGMGGVMTDSSGNVISEGAVMGGQVIGSGCPPCDCN